MEYLTSSDVENLKKAAIAEGYEGLLASNIRPQGIIREIALDMFAGIHPKGKEFSPFNVDLLQDLVRKLRT